MSPAAERKGGFGIVGLAAAACVACGAVPILVLLGGATLAGVAGTVFIGAAGCVIAIPASVAYVIVRRRRLSRTGTDGDDGPVPVGMPTRTAPR